MVGPGLGLILVHVVNLIWVICKLYTTVIQIQQELIY